MAGRIEDNAIVGDMQSVALVSAAGSVDWLCLPRFDSESCFAALLGTQEHGCWRIAPKNGLDEAGGLDRSPAGRRYAGDTLILQTRTLEALLRTGYLEEAKAWRFWLGRAIAGDPEDIQIMYGVAGERRLAEWEASWLPGYENSSPVRIGIAAASQLQLDVSGEVIGALQLSCKSGLCRGASTRAMG